MENSFETQSVSEIKYSFFWKIIGFILVGMISTTFAELWLGFVFITPGTFMNLVEMIVFYGIHVVFYYNLAMKFRRTSLRSLYWWGTLFGLYEAWTTTMVYYGYINKVGHLGEVFGLAFYEYFANVFFWHPLNSFILPLMATQILFYPAFLKQPVSKTRFADTFMYSNKRNKYFWWGYFLYAAGMITSCTYGFELVVITYYLSFYAVILILYFILKKKIGKNNHSPLHLLRVSDRTLGLIGGLIAVYYLFSFAVAVAGEDIYFFDGIFLVVGVIYVFIAAFLISSLNKKIKAFEKLNENNRSLKKSLYKALKALIYLLGVILLLWYLFVFATIAWPHVYNPIAFLIILLTYVFVLTMIKKTGPEDQYPQFEIEDKKPFSSKFLLIGLIMPLIFSMLLRLVLIIAWLFSVFCVELTMILGIVLLLTMTNKTITYKP